MDFRELYLASGAEEFGISPAEYAEALQRVEVGDYRKLHARDLALAQACSRGSAIAWERFVGQYRERVLAMALHLARNELAAREMTETLFGDLFGAANSKFGSYTGRGSLESWLRAILTHGYIDRQRAQKRMVSLEGNPEFFKALAIDPNFAAGPDWRFADAIKNAFSRASDQERFLLAAYFFDGRTLMELGHTLGVHESTVSRRMDRLFRRMRKQIVAELRKRGMPERQIRESLESDVRSFGLDLYKQLTGKMGFAEE